MSAFVLENFWANKAACDDAERAYYEKLSGSKVSSSLTDQIAAARKHIKNSLDSVDNLSSGLPATEEEEMALMKKLGALEVENKELKKVTDDLKSLVLSLQARVDKLDGGKGDAPAAKAAPAPAEDDDEDVDLFGSDDEEDDEEKKRITEERLKAYHEKKAKKPKVIAKTSVLFDVKPWDDETDMDAMLTQVKTIEMEGLVWGASKLVPVGYGIKKLQVMCVVEDEKVSIDELSEKICEFEDFVQSVDIAAMSKI
jgi:elongation factor 1-delta